MPILDFLKDLALNNSREWMEANKAHYLESRAIFEKMVAQLIDEIAKFDPSVQGLTVKDCIFRLNRDVRFSKNKEPYKINLSAYVGPGGKKATMAGYYLHIQPQASFLAGGRFMPEPNHLFKIRQEIDYNADHFLQIIKTDEVKTYFGSITGDKLVRAPKGYPQDHVMLEYLKMKSFLLSRPLEDSLVQEADFIPTCARMFKAIMPLNQFLNQATADENA